MKITGVRTIPYEYELKRSLGDANNPAGNKNVFSLAVFIETDAGITGTSLGSPGARGHIHSFVDNLLLGRDPRGVRGLWQRMVDFVFKGNNRGIVNDAISAIDVALWDLKAKANDEPLWKTLGASTRSVRAYASGIDLSLSDDEIRQFYAEQAARGISVGKLKVGLEMESDLRRIQIMHDALAQSGRKPGILIDSNEYWSPKQAIRHIRTIEQHFEVIWAEEPARRWDYRGLRQVSQGITAAVATGENLDHVSEFMPLVANEAVDVVQVGGGCSGITGMLQVADLAYAFELPVSVMNSPGNMMAHVAAVLPNHIMMEVVDAGRTFGMRIDHPVEDGWITLSDAPGLGLQFDEDVLTAQSADKPSAAATSFQWGRRPGAALYEVGPDEPLERGQE
jgi:L-alanine-DL-glutamate epimerase-like enolase superfamily enzyme